MSGPYTWRNPALVGRDEFAENISTEGNNTLTAFPAISWP